MKVRHFFLRSSTFNGLMSVTIYALLFGGSLRWPLIIMVGGILFLYRSRQIPYKETIKSDGEIFLSPVDSRVARINRRTVADDGQEFIEVRLVMDWWRCWGLYLPYASEAAYLKENDGPLVSRKELHGLSDTTSWRHTDLVLRSKNKAEVLVRFVQCRLGLSPRIWMKSGDRGQGAACFGYYPFGGSLVIYLPIASDILIVEGEEVVAGQTVLAASKTFRG